MEERDGKLFGVVVTTDPSGLRSFEKTNRLPFEVLADTTGWTGHTLGMAVHPYVVFVSARGTVVSAITLGSTKPDGVSIEDVIVELDSWPH